MNFVYLLELELGGLEFGTGFGIECRLKLGLIIT